VTWAKRGFDKVYDEVHDEDQQGTQSAVTPHLDRKRVETALNKARGHLLAQRGAEGYWIGELSSSALSTATAVCALAICRKHSTAPIPESVVERGLSWLAKHANADGGWGDTTLSLSNISTTTLCWAAFGAVPGADEGYQATVRAAESWIRQRAGGLDPGILAPAIIKRYGKDRTFSVPILTMCALAGRLGVAPDCWQWVKQLPFELAAFPHQMFAALRLPVVSYALPALIAIGHARHRHRPTRNPITRLARSLVSNRTLRVLTEIQPSNGGFLEATPLTSFVTMSLAGSGLAGHPVCRKGVEFLLASQRADGNWPIDTNLCTWVTTLAVDALGSVAKDERGRLRDWLLRQQYQREHPYTHAAPGGWAWTDLPGGVPDADDTSGALLALKTLGDIDEPTRKSATAGVRWLLDLQNRDGGIPTFCRGWGALPFDRSSADITAHAIRAWLAWADDLPELQRRINDACRRALRFLTRAQRPDGAWIPLWFGNQFAPDEENPIYGTSRVLLALATARPIVDEGTLNRGATFLIRSQNPDGSWGHSIEETALALEALAAAQRAGLDSNVELAIARGGNWLLERVESGEWQRPAPIGFYFAKLWYFEELYPLIFATGALRRLCDHRP
jgi:squalene-hopene/tetraprenyl-beta-curcumene cyclase